MQLLLKLRGAQPMSSLEARLREFVVTFVLVTFGCSPLGSTSSPLAVDGGAAAVDLASAPDLASGDLASAPTVDLASASPPDLATASPDLADPCAGVVCTAADPCHGAGSCDPQTGHCSSPVVSDGTACAVSAGSGSCQAGACTVASCDSGRADCDGAAGNGCEVDLTSDGAHCGACGVACAAGELCASGACRPAWCSSVAGSLDQAQLQCPGWNVVLSPSQEPVGQTFVAGATGQLTGVEVSIGRCGVSDANARVQLVLADGQGTALATASVPVASLPDHCGAALVADSITGAFFDLTPACVAVTAGDALSVSMILTDVTADSCNQTNGTCYVSGSYCDFDQDCQPALRVSMASDVYAGGTVTVRGNALGYDSVFKTFVR